MDCDKNTDTDTNKNTKQSDTLDLKEFHILFEKCLQIHAFLGLSYCMNSKAFYLSILNEYLSGDKRKGITEAYEKEDNIMTEYTALLDGITVLQEELG